MKKRAARRPRATSSSCARAGARASAPTRPTRSFKVGAALRTRTGEIVTGCNIENASYGLTLCAERVAVFKAVSEGLRRLRRDRGGRRLAKLDRALRALPPDPLGVLRRHLGAHGDARGAARRCACESCSPSLSTPRTCRRGYSSPKWRGGSRRPGAPGAPRARSGSRARAPAGRRVAARATSSSSAIAGWHMSSVVPELQLAQDPERSSSVAPASKNVLDEAVGRGEIRSRLSRVFLSRRDAAHRQAVSQASVRAASSRRDSCGVVMAVDVRRRAAHELAEALELRARLGQDVVGRRLGQPVGLRGELARTRPRGERIWLRARPAGRRR